MSIPFGKFEVTVHDRNSVTLSSPDFIFIYQNADSMVKDEFKGQYKYYGGFQSNLDPKSEEYKKLEQVMANIAEVILYTWIIWKEESVPYQRSQRDKDES